MAERDNLAIAREIYEAFNQRELAQIAHYTSPDGKWVNVATGQVFRGPQGALEAAREWLTPLPDMSLEMGNPIAAGDSVVAELTARGTHTGELSTPGGVVSATGRRVSLKLCEVLQFRNGKVMSARRYFDVATLMQQLGITVGGKGEKKS